jgi:hypothetical protein
LDTGHDRFEASLRLARLEGLLEVGHARLLAAMLGDLGVSTLRSIKTDISSRLRQRHLLQVSRPLSPASASVGSMANRRGVEYETSFSISKTTKKP